MPIKNPKRKALVSKWMFRLFRKLTPYVLSCPLNDAENQDTKAGDDTQQTPRYY